MLRFQGKIIEKLLSWVFTFLENHGIIYLQTLSMWTCKKIIKTVNERIKVGKENYNWWVSFENFDFKIVDECITDNCLKH